MPERCEGTNHDGSRCEREATRYLMIVQPLGSTEGAYCRAHARQVASEHIAAGGVGTITVEAANR